MKEKKNPHLGSTFDSFLKEEGIYEEVKAEAMKKIIALQIRNEMEKKNLTQADVARLMNTSRSAVQRLLDPKNVSITLLTLNKAAAVLDKDLEINLH